MSCWPAARPACTRWTSGYGQLAEKLRHDQRVVSMERVNARTLTAATLPEPADLAVIDVAFISLALVLGPVLSDAARRARLHRRARQAAVRGRTSRTRRAASCGIARSISGCCGDHRGGRRELGLGTRDVIASPILGPEGNREFLAWLGAGPSCAELEPRIEAAVAAAWEDAS